jgi:hypothetical protein
LVSNKVFWKSDQEGGLQTLPLIEEYWFDNLEMARSLKSNLLA